MRNKRKSYVIDRSFQYRLIATFLISSLVALALFTAGTALYYWASSMVGDNIFREFIDINKQVFVSVVGEDGETIRIPETKTIYGVKRWEIVLPPILINNVLILIVIGIIGLFYSHRIVGPVFRTNRDLQRVLDGETEVLVKIRDKDQFQDLAGRVNALLKSFYELKNQNDDL